MTTRRTFLKVSAGAAGFCTMGGAIANAERGPSPNFIIAERSIPDALAAARHLFGTDASLLQFDADPVMVWERHILPAIDGALITVAGVTSGHAAFSLSEIARDYGLVLTRSQSLDVDKSKNTCLDAVSLNQPIRVIWTMEPKGIKFR